MTTAQRDKAFRPLYDAIFDALEPEFGELGFAPRVKENQFHNEIAFATEYDRIHYRVGFWMSQRNQIHAYAWIARQHAGAFNRQIYMALQRQRTDINHELTVEIENSYPVWNLPTNGKERYGAVGIGTSGSPDGSSKSVEEMKEWMLKSLPHVQNVLAPRIAEIWRNL